MQLVAHGIFNNQIDCTEHRIEIEVSEFSWNDYFYRLSGIVHGGDAIVYYLKTYRDQEVSADRIVHQGKSTVAREGKEFTVSIRDQGVYQIFLVAEELLSHCYSSVFILDQTSPGKRISSPTCYFQNVQTIIISGILIW